MNNECAVIIGVGERQGIGAAVALRAATEGLHVYLAGRTKAKLDAIVSIIEANSGKATAVVTDSSDVEQVNALFEQIAESGDALTLMVYNTGRNIPSPFLKSDRNLLEGHWRRCVLGGFAAGQAALRLMLAREEIDGSRGTIIYTGASASIRGKPMFAGFSAAKAGLRAMAQSMAREFGPRGVHVAHVVVDGIVDGAVVRGLEGGIGRLILNRKGQHGALQPDEVAKSFWMLHQQQRSAWTQELDVRPFKESF